MDRQIKIVSAEFNFRFDFDHRYALLLIPNAYYDMLMLIFTSCLFFKCVFIDFQCVITLLRSLSVALNPPEGIALQSGQKLL